MTVSDIIGLPALLEQCAEECSELSQASLKLARKLRGENPTPKNTIEITQALNEEIADVLLCVEALVDADIISNEAIDAMRLYKADRWNKRLNGMDVQTSMVEEFAGKDKGGNNYGI